MTYEYDGSFAGFLCVAKLLRERPDATALARKRGSGEASLFTTDAVWVETDRPAAAAFNRELCLRAGSEAADAVRDAFFSDYPEMESALLSYIDLCFQAGEGVRNRLDLGPVQLTEKAAKRTRGEAHLFTGIARFSELRDGSLYAVIEPRCAILHIIKYHFERRFPGFLWVIHDKAHDAALVHEPGKKAVFVFGLRLESPEGAAPPTDAGDLALPLLSDGELAFRRAWKGYVKTIAIMERKNPKVQRGHLPKQYWNHLPELLGDEPSQP
jgi:probable DNA metabolism protein